MSDLELIDWVESQAQENLKFRLNCLESIIKECNTTLTILLAGIGGISAYLFKQLETTNYKAWLIAGSIGLGLYLVMLSGLLIIKCLKIDEIQVPTNEPKNLYVKQYTLLEIREGKLINVQKRINKAMERNLKTSDWLNKIRLAMLATPLIFIICAILAVAFFP
jgi:hypothetical protein